MGSIQNAQLFLSQEGFGELDPSDDATIDSLDEFGRQEGYIGFSDRPLDQAFMSATAVREQNKAPRSHLTGEVRPTGNGAPGTADRPLIDYGLGDEVSVPRINAVDVHDPDPDVRDWVRLEANTITEDSRTGVCRFVPEYVNSAELWQQLVDQWLRRVSNASQGGRVASASPNSPSIISSEIIEPIVQSFGGDDSPVDETGHPWVPSFPVLAVGATAAVKEAGPDPMVVYLTANDIDIPGAYIELPAGDTVASINWRFRIVLNAGWRISVRVDQDGGSPKPGVDMLFAPWPFPFPTGS